MRNRNYDVIRATATLMVVCIHSMSPLRDSISVGATASANWICALYYAIIGTGVPMFFMLSGALLIGKDDSPLDFYRRRFPRILIPFTIWSGIVYLLNWVLGGMHVEHFVGNFCTQFFSLTGVNEAYWFVYVLLFFYLLTPFIAYIRSKTKHPMLWLTALVATFILLKIAAYYSPSFYQPARWTAFLICYVAGYILRSVHTPHALLVGVFSMAMHAMTLVFGWISLPWDLISAIALFVAINSLPERQSTQSEDAIGFISRMSYGIYLSHIIFCSILVQLSAHMTWIPVACLPLLIAVLVMSLEYVMMHVLEHLGISKFLC